MKEDWRFPSSLSAWRRKRISGGAAGEQTLSTFPASSAGELRARQLQLRASAQSVQVITEKCGFDSAAKSVLFQDGQTDRTGDIDHLILTEETFKMRIGGMDSAVSECFTGLRRDVMFGPHSGSDVFGEENAFKT